MKQTKAFRQLTVVSRRPSVPFGRTDSDRLVDIDRRRFCGGSSSLLSSSSCIDEDVVFDSVSSSSSSSMSSRPGEKTGVEVGMSEKDGNGIILLPHTKSLQYRQYSRSHSAEKYWQTDPRATTEKRFTPTVCHGARDSQNFREKI